MNQVNMLARMKWNDTLFHCVKLAFNEGVSAGAFPEDRAEPSGEESVAWISGSSKVVAFATFYETDHGKMWIDVLWVDPGFRREGKAATLIAAIEAHASALGYGKIAMGVKADNGTMIHTAIAASFNAAGIVMEKGLAGPAPVFSTSDAAGAIDDPIPF